LFDPTPKTQGGDEFGKERPVRVIDDSFSSQVLAVGSIFKGRDGWEIEYFGN